MSGAGFPVLATLAILFGAGLAPLVVRAGGDREDATTWAVTGAASAAFGAGVRGGSAPGGPDSPAIPDEAAVVPQGSIGSLLTGPRARYCDPFGGGRVAVPEPAHSLSSPQLDALRNGSLACEYIDSMGGAQGE